MQQSHGDYQLDDDRTRIDITRVHEWLSSTYWCPGIRRDVVQRAIDGSSLVVGCYLKTEQVAVARVVSDRATFAWICDVFVDQAHRKKGIARAMVRFAMSHPEHQGLRRWLLGTKDAHGVYTALGFKPLEEPQRFLTLRPDPRGWAESSNT